MLDRQRKHLRVGGEERQGGGAFKAKGDSTVERGKVDVRKRTAATETQM